MFVKKCRAGLNRFCLFLSYAQHNGIIKAMVYIMTENLL